MFYNIDLQSTPATKQSILPTCFLLLYFALPLTGCVTVHHPSDDLENQPTLSPEEISAAIDGSSEDYQDFVQSLPQLSVVDKKELDQILVAMVKKNAMSWGTEQLKRALEIYRYSSQQYPWLIFRYTTLAKKKEAMRLAWGSLQHVPRSHDQLPKHRDILDSILSKALQDNTINHHLVPEMANIAKAWQVKSVYGILKLGLLSTEEPSFVESMAFLKPTQATHDFMNYLVLIPDQDLRQLTVSEITDITILDILKHFRRFPPELGHHHIGKIFVFAASRQMKIREHALALIDDLTGQGAEILAYTLSRQKKWVQQSLIEESRRQMTGNRKLLLSHLAKLTPDKSIAEEISWLQNMDPSTTNNQ
ncbi:MAG: hypothetical protein OXC40_05885 [Proteobacteria bacterium]|nr:hypothetical protein [Pseudomonadota bacterium]